MRNGPTPWLAAFVFVSVATSSGQQNKPEDTETIIRTNVSRVVLDLVARDKHEHLVRDLKPVDIEVYEDGVKRDLIDFRLVTGAEVGKAEAAAEAVSPKTLQTNLAPINSAKEVNLIALVAAPGDTSERQYARRAAEEFLSYNLRPNTWVTIFKLGRPLQVVQSLTNDPVLLKLAFDRLMNKAPDQLSISPQSAAAARVTPSSTAVLPGSVPGGTEAGLDMTSAAAALEDASVSTTKGADLQRARELEDQLDMADQVGVRQYENLKEVIRTLAPLPGRKTVLLMTSALTLPPDFQELMPKLIAFARGSNVTFYSLNTIGLSRTDWNQAAVADLKGAAAISATQSDKREVTKAKAMELDLSQYAVISANQETPLKLLAEGTGGFLISNTNDPSRALRRVMEEVNTHYELTWSPKSAIYDGHFRRIEVKFLRSDLHGAYRSGYFALPNLDRKPLEPYELSALRFLDTKPLPHDLDYKMAEFQFQPNRDSWQYELAFQAAISSFSLAAGSDTLHKRVEGAFVAAIKDQSGEIVRVVSQDIPFQIPAQNADQFRQGDFDINIPVSLPPGRYVTESVVIDRQSGRASAKRTALIVGPVSPFAISGIALVKKLNPAESSVAENPFRYSNVVVEPGLSGIVPKGANVMLSFTVYSQVSDPKPVISIHYSREGKEVERQMIEVQDIEPNGAIPVIASARLAPGDYEAIATAKQNDSTVRQAISFRVE